LIDRLEVILLARSWSSASSVLSHSSETSTGLKFPSIDKETAFPSWGAYCFISPLDLTVVTSESFPEKESPSPSESDSVSVLDCLDLESDLDSDSDSDDFLDKPGGFGTTYILQKACVIEVHR
jgi:hypothetical protein